jgi:hypothetical protein
MSKNSKLLLPSREGWGEGIKINQLNPHPEGERSDEKIMLFWL